MLYPIIDNVQFDLNVTCNAFCPGCHRYAFKDDKMYLNPYLTFNTSVDVSVIENIVQNSRLADDVWLDFVGLVGEPAAHKQFLEITDIIYKYKPNAVIQIHTNGGLRSTEFWKELAPKIMRQDVESSVVFSIDGLEDTNNTYRIGVLWEKVMENAKAYIDAGGRATWKCIEFPWNSHQKDEIQQLAKSMGMQQFRWEPNRDADSERMIKYMKAAKEFHKKTKIDSEDFNITNEGSKHPDTKNLSSEVGNQYKSFTEIEDKCFSENTIYVNYDGRVIPCCMFNGATTDPAFKEEMIPFIYDGNDKDWNNLYKNSLEDVLTNSWWTRLYSSFTDTPCSVCVSSCEKR